MTTVIDLDELIADKIEDVENDIRDRWDEGPIAEVMESSE